MGEATELNKNFKIIEIISIHASRGGSDEDIGVEPDVVELFQSTLPVGEATKKFVAKSVLGKISIHASRGGSDVA